MMPNKPPYIIRMPTPPPWCGGVIDIPGSIGREGFEKFRANVIKLIDLFEEDIVGTEPEAEPVEDQGVRDGD